MTPKKFAFRVGWFVIGVLSLVFAALLWLAGLFSGGLDSQEMCGLRYGQSYDRQYLKAHPEHAGRNLFPLSDKCNADYDMVPGWMNPAIVALAGLGVTTTVVLPLNDLAVHIRRRTS